MGGLAGYLWGRGRSHNNNNNSNSNGWGWWGRNNNHNNNYDNTNSGWSWFGSHKNPNYDASNMHRVDPNNLSNLHVGGDGHAQTTPIVVATDTAGTRTAAGFGGTRRR